MKCSTCKIGSEAYAVCKECIRDYEKQITELQEKLTGEQKFSAGLQGELKIAEDKLHRRNRQIADLKKEVIYYKKMVDGEKTDKPY